MKNYYIKVYPPNITLKRRWWTMSTVYLDEQKQSLGTILHL